jgi:hypothetical protein
MIISPACRVEGLEPEHRPDHTLYGAMILFHDITPVDHGRRAYRKSSLMKNVTEP